MEVFGAGPELYHITYTVNPDCSGTKRSADGVSFGLFVAPNGEEVIVFGARPGSFWCRVRTGESHRGSDIATGDSANSAMLGCCRSNYGISHSDRLQANAG